ILHFTAMLSLASLPPHPDSAVPAATVTRGAQALVNPAALPRPHPVVAPIVLWSAAPLHQA
ncbi:hypothetical protein EIP86_003163, partial [Pleurotus ostreatoroseus]